MSRVNEIIRRLGQGGDEIKAIVPEASRLSNRFLRVQMAAKRLLQKDARDSGKIFKIDWTGYDAGVHDAWGELEGRVGGVGVNMKMKATRVDSNPQIVDEGGKWNIVDGGPSEHLRVSGSFVSRDGKTGFFVIEVGSQGGGFQAYWLETCGEWTRLEEVVGPDGKVYDVSMVPEADQFCIPGTGTCLVRKRKI